MPEALCAPDEERETLLYKFDEALEARLREPPVQVKAVGMASVRLESFGLLIGVTR